MRRPILIFSTLLSLLLSNALHGQEITYGFQQVEDGSLAITALAYPDFSSNDVTISTAVFSFFLPAGTVIEQINRQPVTSVRSAREALGRGRNIFLLNLRGVYRYVAITLN